MSRESVQREVAQRLAARKVRRVPDACTARSQRCHNARDYQVELRPCCRAHLVAVVTRAAAALTAAGAVWWADYGTLLGAVRNQLTTWADYPWLPQDGRTTAGPAPGIVPHDKDADLGVAWSSYDVVRRLLVGDSAFHVHALPTRHSLKLMRSRVNQTNVDLFFWKESAGSDVVTWWGKRKVIPAGHLYREQFAEVDRNKGKDFHRDMLFPLGTVEWEGLTLPAPRDPEAFLEMRYGPGWRSPIAANNDGVPR